jgi:hypothetical protein
VPLIYPIVIPAVMFLVPQAGHVVAVPAEPKLYVPFVKFNTLDALGVMVKPPSLNILFAVTSPIVSVLMVAAAANDTPVALFDFKVL